MPCPKAARRVSVGPHRGTPRTAEHDSAAGHGPRGLSLAQARTCYAFLITQLNLNEMAAVQFHSPWALLWGIRPHNLERALTSRVGRNVAREFTGLCTFRPGRSPVSAPLIPYCEHVLNPLGNRVPYRLRTDAAPRGVCRPQPFRGARGNARQTGRRWAERLRVVPGCTVTTEILVKDERPDCRRPGCRRVGSRWDGSS